MPVECTGMNKLKLLDNYGNDLTGQMPAVVCSVIDENRDLIVADYPHEV